MKETEQLHSRFDDVDQYKETLDQRFELIEKSINEIGTTLKKHLINYADMIQLIEDKSKYNCIIFIISIFLLFKLIKKSFIEGI